MPRSIALAFERKRTVDKNCNNQDCNPKGLAAAQEGPIWTTLSTIAFGAGIAGVGAGAYLLLKPVDSVAAGRLRPTRAWGSYQATF
jgi:hypothetical protein